MTEKKKALRKWSVQLLVNIRQTLPQPRPHLSMSEVARIIEENPEWEELSQKISAHNSEIIELIGKKLVEKGEPI